MREVLAAIDKWFAKGEHVALATVIQTWGSAPRREGAKMAMTPTGSIAGSVSGGCVEGAVFEAGVASLESARPKLLSFGVADETAWDVGLACGGQIRVFVESIDPALHDLINELLADDEAVAVATMVSGRFDLVGRKLILKGQNVVLCGLPDHLVEPVTGAMAEAMTSGHSHTYTLQDGPDSFELFVDVLLPAPALIMVGGVHIAIALASLAKSLNFRCIVIDPRRAFGSEERFSHADQLIQSWPDKAFAQLSVHRSTAVVMLTHDPKIDDPALMHVLRSPAFYIGALGSKKTHAKRRQRLLAVGISAGAIERIHAPIGLDIGAQTPEEIAIAIMAEIVAVQHKG